MERVTGIGGIFFKSSDPKALAAWYEKHLGVPVESWGGASFKFKDMEEPDRESYLVWTPFKNDTKYFEPSTAPFMINFRVRNLEAMLAQLREAGVTVDTRVEESEFGRFGWCLDPDGNRLELWEPPARRPD